MGGGKGLFFQKSFTLLSQWLWISHQVQRCAAEWNLCMKAHRMPEERSAEMWIIMLAISSKCGRVLSGKDASSAVCEFSYFRTEAQSLWLAVCQLIGRSDAWLWCWSGSGAQTGFAVVRLPFSAVLSALFIFPVFSMFFSFRLGFTSLLLVDHWDFFWLDFSNLEIWLHFCSALASCYVPPGSQLYPAQKKLLSLIELIFYIYFSFQHFLSSWTNLMCCNCASTHADLLYWMIKPIKRWCRLWNMYSSVFLFCRWRALIADV